MRECQWVHESTPPDLDEVYTTYGIKPLSDDQKASFEKLMKCLNLDPLPSASPEPNEDVPLPKNMQEATAYTGSQSRYVKLPVLEAENSGRPYLRHFKVLKCPEGYVPWWNHRFSGNRDGDLFDVDERRALTGGPSSWRAVQTSPPTS